MSELKGVTYYQLPENKGYKGDTYKNKKTGLTGLEVDNNFLFLRGYDISDIKFSDDNDTIIFKRVNGKEDVRLSGFNRMLDISKSTYDSKNGILTLSVGYGEKKIHGFRDVDIDKSWYDNNDGVFHLVINDTEYKVSGFMIPPYTFLSGTLSPVKKILDNVQELPQHHDIGDAYIVKNDKNVFGNSYNMDALLALDNYLAQNGSEWQIPSFEDWGNMLNGVEICDVDREHLIKIGELKGYVDKVSELPKDPVLGDEYKVIYEEDDKNNGFYVCVNTSPLQWYNIGPIFDGLGRYAGLLLKDDKWCDASEKENFGKKYFFNALPPKLTENQCDFWAASTKNDEYWIKTFRNYTNNGEKETKIPSNLVFEEKIFDNESLFPIRLFKTSRISVSGYENIEGKEYKCCILPYNDGDITKNTVWMAENLNLNADFLTKYAIKGHKDINVRENSGVRLTEYAYYVWNGYEWDIRVLPEGESFVMFHDDTKIYEEFRLNNGEIVMVFQSVYDNIDALKEYCDNLSRRIDGVVERIEIIENKFNNYYTKEETNRFIEEINQKFGNYYDKEYINNKVEELENKISKAGKVKDVQLWNKDSEEYVTVVDENGVAKIKIEGGGGGPSYVSEDIKDKNGNIIIPKGSEITEAVKRIISLINNADDDISIVWLDNETPILRINGISND